MKKNIIKIAKEVVKMETTSLKKLEANIGKSFEQIIKTIINCKNGKILISGVGKSGIIGKKWSATLSSTGTPSFFLDASNASHGDMGQITSNDILILISLSGQSEELKNIIQYTSRNKNIKLIGITSKKDSLLYKNSDLKFLLPSVKEAGPGNIVPTSSTTVQVALGDAIAITCMVGVYAHRSTLRRVRSAMASASRVRHRGSGRRGGPMRSSWARRWARHSPVACCAPPASRATRSTCGRSSAATGRRCCVW